MLQSEPMDGNEIAEMFYGSDPDPLYEFLNPPTYLDWSDVERGMVEACRNLEECNARFFKRSDA